MKLDAQYFSGLLIDFDGTLADTEKLHQLALKTFFERKELEFEKKEPEKSTFHIFRDWGKNTGKPLRAKRYLVEYLTFLIPFFAQHRKQIDWHEDAKIFLEKTAHFPRVLITGSLHPWLSVLNSRLHIFDHFTRLVTKEDVLPDHEKPDPLPYLLGARKLGFIPERCVAIEDSFSGILSAKNAGCFVIAVHRGETKGFEYADKVVDTLTELSFS